MEAVSAAVSAGAAVVGSLNSMGSQAIATSFRRSSGADAKFFNSSKKGELVELKEELQNPSKDRKRDAVKKVREYLFSDVMKALSLTFNP